MDVHPKLIVCDLDSTLFSWFEYFSFATKKSIETAASITGIPYKQLCEEYKQILDRDDAIEHPFVIQQLPSILAYYNNDFSKILSECSEPAREQFKLTAYPYLKPYPSVLKTLQNLKDNYPNTKLAILTDAPLALGLYRLNKLGILHYFDGVYGLESPKLPIVNGEIPVTKDILFKHLDGWKYGFIGECRELPNKYRKPNVKGFKHILLDFNIDSFSKTDIFFVGDNVYKDIKLANDMNIASCLALYGLKIDPTSIDVLREFVPERFIHKGIVLEGDYPQPTHKLDHFSDVLTHLNQSETNQSLPVSVPEESH